VVARKLVGIAVRGVNEVRLRRSDTDPSEIASRAIEKAGIKAGQTVLDFGCGSGVYTIPLARVVGDRGEVYALDKDRHALDGLMQRAGSAGLANIKRLDTPGGTQIALANGSVDVVLLFDVFHYYYFSSVAERRDLLGEISRVLKPGGFLSVYPKHMETEARAEIEESGFSIQNDFSITLVHDRTDTVEGQIMNFQRQAAG
jgi:ubiquinone/menaquinone biosynthesis C-methylase UbiE